MSKNPYQRITDKLNIEQAIRNVTRNDLLPPRPEDRVRGELGARFSEHLIRTIERGEHDPLPSYSVSVPKSRLTTRPAALLSFSDRVLYEAIVAILRPRIEQFLLGPGIVYWPRGTQSEPHWEDFESSAAKPRCKYVARADIVGFYESIDHERLGMAVVAATGFREVADALNDFLERVMPSRRGLPQGLVPSDSLATLYLAEVDFAMARSNFQYSRHGDDFRISATTYDEGCRAVRSLEAALRENGLFLNVDKTRILRVETYRKQVSHYSTIIQNTKSRMLKARVRNLHDNDFALQAAIDDSGMDQLAWDLFYHHSIDAEDAIEQLRPSIQPSDVEVAEELFREAVTKRPGKRDSLPREIFHQQITHSLVRLAAGRSPSGVDRAAGLIRMFPEKTETICSYLSSMNSVSSATFGVVRQLESAMSTQQSEHDLAWIIRTLDRYRGNVSTNVRELIKTIVSSPHGRWLAAVQAAKLLAGLGELEHDVLLLMWDTCPAVLRSDLVEAGARMATNAAWAKAFVSGVQSNPVHKVVAHHELQDMIGPEWRSALDSG